MPCTDLVMRVYLEGMIATGFLAAAMLDEIALYQHLNVALHRLRGDAGFSLNLRNAEAGMGAGRRRDGVVLIAFEDIASVNLVDYVIEG